MPKVIARCRMSHPQLEIVTHEDFFPYLLDSVVQGELDLALVSLPIRDQRVVTESLFREPLQLIVGFTHPLCQKEAITGRDLRDETFIMLGTSSSVTAQIQRFCGDHNFEPKVGHKCSQVATIKTLVALGLGVAILPASTHAAGDEQMLVYKEISGGAPTREIGLVRHPRRYQSRGTSQFIATLRATLARDPIPLLSVPAAARP
jgi:LysR family hydrogen peroxide-inducible transcriptional activator